MNFRVKSQWCYMIVDKPSVNSESLINCSRVAFGFSIYDENENVRMEQASAIISPSPSQNFVLTQIVDPNRRIPQQYQHTYNVWGPG